MDEIIPEEKMRSALEDGLPNKNSHESIMVSLKFANFIRSNFDLRTWNDNMISSFI